VRVGPPGEPLHLLAGVALLDEPDRVSQGPARQGTAHAADLDLDLDRGQLAREPVRRGEGVVVIGLIADEGVAGGGASVAG
jgi:hypothetical protein